MSEATRPQAVHGRLRPGRGLGRFGRGDLRVHSDTILQKAAPHQA